MYPTKVGQEKPIEEKIKKNKIEKEKNAKKNNKKTIELKDPRRGHKSERLTHLNTQESHRNTKLETIIGAGELSVFCQSCILIKR